MKTRPFLALLSLALLCGCRERSLSNAVPDPRITGDRISFPPDAPQLGVVAVQPVARADSASTRLFGRLAWDEDATVRVFTPFSGRVRRVLVDLGSPVAKGEPLAIVESSDYGQMQADARTATSAERLAESNRARLHELYDHGAAPLKDVEAADAEWARAGSECARAQARLASYGGAADSVTGVFLLRSPIAGTVVERNLTVGQEIRSDQMLANAPQLFSPLFVLSDPTRLWIQIDATEDELACLRPGAPFRFASTALPGRVFDGTVDLVGDAIDPGTHTIRARGRVDNRQRLLKAEMFVSVEVPARPTHALSVPWPAVILKGDRHYVFVEERPGVFARREVAIGDERDNHVVVTRGVRAGERVVTDGSVLLEQLLD